jgi:serine/threonine-protein kinase
MDCGDANWLLAYADGILSSERARAAGDHLDGCASCRVAVAALARHAGDETTAEPRTPVPAAAVLPAASDFLRQYLRDDAPQREMTIGRVWIAIAAVSLLSLVPPVFLDNAGFAIAGVAVQGAFLIYELALVRSLRRGRFHTAQPLISTVVEASMFAAMQVVAVLALPAQLAVIHPGLILRGAAVVFTAIRAEPRLCLVAGAAAAAESLVIAVPLWLRGADAVAVAPGLVVRALFLALAGVAGAALARYLVSRAARALAELRAQDLFGKYLVGERLGGGGMGEVLRATYCPEGGFVRAVAIKRLRADLSGDPRFEDAFRREAHLCASLSHPNLVQVLDCGKYRGQFVLAMELVDGASLRRLVEDGPLDPHAVAYLGVELAAALDYIHRRRGADGAPLALVHCDVNPPNILVSRAGEVKLGDVGVARAAAPLLQPGSGRFGGKVTYAAPEQLAGLALDARTDLYAVGLTLHEALTGVPVHADEASVTHVVPPPSSRRAGVPVDLERIVMSLLAVDRDDRPADAAALRRALFELGPESAPQPRGEAALVAAVERAAAMTVPPPAEATAPGTTSAAVTAATVQLGRPKK